MRLTELAGQAQVVVQRAARFVEQRQRPLASVCGSQYWRAMLAPEWDRCRDSSQIDIARTDARGLNGPLAGHRPKVLALGSATALLAY